MSSMKRIISDPIIATAVHTGAWFEHAINGVVSGPDAASRQKLVSSFHPGMELMLEREPFNKFDQNALKVMYGKRQVGYVSAKPKEFFDTPGGLAGFLSPRIENGEKWRAVIQAVVGGKPGLEKQSYGCRIILVMISGEGFSFPSHYPLGEKEDNFQIWPEKSEATTLLEGLYKQWPRLTEDQREQMHKWSNAVKRFGGAPVHIREKMKEMLDGVEVSQEANL
jgi:hypothetical protein